MAYGNEMVYGNETLHGNGVVYGNEMVCDVGWYVKVGGHELKVVPYVEVGW